MRRILHAGCGNEPLPSYFGECEEVRLDANPDENPDIVASLADLGEIGPFDMAYTSHCLEHLYPHEIQTALKELLRVTHGFVMVIVPDLEDLKINDEVLYVSPAGPITAMDMIYGHKEQVINPHMAHHTGFTSAILKAALLDAGFKDVKVTRFEPYNLMAVASTVELNS